MKNNQYKPSWKNIYIVQEQPIKQSNLSVAARSKIINKTGSNYSSQNPKNYGPCIPFNQDCECNFEELQRQEQILKNREIEERIRRERSENQQEENEQVNRNLQNQLTSLQRSFQDLQEENRNVLQVLGINNLSDLPDLLNGKSLTDFLNRATQRQSNWWWLNSSINTEQQLTQVQRERDNARQERDARPNVSVEEYNQLVSENQELKNQQITEIILDIDLSDAENLSFENNFRKIENKVKSLKKLIVFFNYKAETSKITDEWVERVQKFINQNVNLTHLDISASKLSSNKSSWKKGQNFDFSKLTKLVFLSIPAFPNRKNENNDLELKDLDLKENKELETLILKGVIYGLHGGLSEINNLMLKENKKLKCLIFKDEVKIYSLDLSENKDLEYVNITLTRVKHLNLSRNRKITSLGGSFSQEGTWKIEYDRGFVTFDRNRQAVELTQ